MDYDSDLSDGNLNILEELAKPLNTIKATQWGVNKFSKWSSKRNIICF